MQRGKQLSISDVAIVGVFSALAVTLGYLLAPIPNIELFTATIFLSGFLFGIRNGVLVGIFASLLFGIYNPWGPSPGPLLIAQVITRSLVGLTGGFFGRIDWPSKPFWLKALSFATAGFLLTSIYTAAAALSFVIPAGFSADKLAAEIVAGFFLISLGTMSNVIIFAVVLPAVAEVLRRTAFFRYSEIGR